MKSIPRISDAEWEIMKVLWRRAPSSAQVVIDSLEGTTHWHPTTVRTLLNRLVRKGVLNFKREGRAYIYSPTLTEAECRTFGRDGLSRSGV